MAVLTMKKIHILGLKQDRKAILEYIQSTGTLQVDMALAENSIFKRTNKMFTFFYKINYYLFLFLSIYNI